MEEINNFKIGVLAIIQGLTEFLPVSSSGHLVLTPQILGFKDPGLAIDAFLHLGTLFAALIYFRKDISLMLRALFNNFNSKSENKTEALVFYNKLWLGILIASIPVIIIGFGFKRFFTDSFIRSSDFVAYMLIAGAFLMFIADKFSLGQNNIAKLSIRQMLFIGCMQCLALFPGVSRSGSTIAAGLFTGLKRDEAARFSFLLGLPAITGAGLLALKDLLEANAMQEVGLQVLIIGLSLSFISGYLAIDFLLKFLAKNSLIFFIVYRIVLGVYILF